MNIGSGIENLTQIFPAQEVSSPAAKAPTGGPTANLAPDQAQISQAGTRAAQSPSDADVRLDKVASIQNALAAGTYQVPASAVAQKVISALLAPQK